MAQAFDLAVRFPPFQGNCCPQLQVLQISTGMNCNSTPLQLPVEALQKGCPQLQVFIPYSLPPATPRSICSLPLLPGAAAAESDLASQALWPRHAPGTRLPQSRGALLGRLHL